MAAPPVPPDLPAALWRRVRGGARFAALARRPSDDAPLFVVCAPLADLADLVGGSPAVWSDVDDPARLAGPRLALVMLPEDGSRLARELAVAQAGGGHWPFACSPDLADVRSRATCERMACDEALNVVLCDAREAQVASRLAFRISDATIATLRQTVRAAGERWPAERTL
jgi:hypothetical protein